MANQVEVPKLTEHPLVGPNANSVAAPKLVMHVLLTPGTGDDGSNRQGHVHSQIIRRS